MKVYYAHGGGYTELGGMKEFLLKINSEISYERIFPVRVKPRKKISSSNRTKGVMLRYNSSGVTGKKLFKEILRRLHNKKKDNENVSVLVIIDDTDCKLSNKTAREQFYRSIEEFKRRALEIYENLKIIFIWAEPEIERWFCLDLNNCFHNKPCGIKDLHRKLSELLRDYSFEYDFEKGSCKEKFSKKFEYILNECGLNYSKKNDGSLLLRRVNPYTIEAKDKFASLGIKQIRNLSNGG